MNVYNRFDADNKYYGKFMRKIGHCLSAKTLRRKQKKVKHIK